MSNCGKAVLRKAFYVDRILAKLISVNIAFLESKREQASAQVFKEPKALLIIFILTFGNLLVLLLKVEQIACLLLLVTIREMSGFIF